MSKRNLIAIMSGIAVAFCFAIGVIFIVEQNKGSNRIFSPEKHQEPVTLTTADTSVTKGSAKKRTAPLYHPGKAESIVNLAISLLGTKYRFASCTPDGFDCSGFVYYVFTSSGIPVSRSSYTMVEEGIEIDSAEAQKGDLIFFTGTDPNDRTVGHVGIIISEKGEPIRFIHSSSGKTKNGVIITNLTDGSYLERYVKIKRIIGQ